MKYYYLFVLIIIISGGISEGRIMRKSELNKDQGNQIESLIITSQYEEKGVANKANKMTANIPYCIIRLCNEATPMPVNDQFVIPVLKYGIPGKEPEYDDDNESPRLLLYTGKSKGCYS